MVDSLVQEKRLFKIGGHKPDGEERSRQLERLRVVERKKEKMVPI